jgi:hypothetical protein
MNWKRELASLGKMYLSYALVAVLAIIAAIVVLEIWVLVMKLFGR